MIKKEHSTAESGAAKQSTTAITVGSPKCVQPNRWVRQSTASVYSGAANIRKKAIHQDFPSRRALCRSDSPSVAPISSIASGFTRFASCGTTAYRAGQRRSGRSSGSPPGCGSRFWVSQMRNPANMASITGLIKAFFRLLFRLPPVICSPEIEKKA